MALPFHQSQVTNTPDYLPSIYRALPIHEPTAVQNQAEVSHSFASAVIKPWPLSLMSSPRRRLPQTSSLVWEERKRAKDPPLSQSRQSQLSEFSPYEASLVSAHLRSIREQETVDFTLPDQSEVRVSRQLEPLLKEILSCRVIHMVVRFLYCDRADWEFDGVFRYVFSLQQQKAIMRLEQCPVGTTTLVLAPHHSISMHPAVAAFDPLLSAIVHIDQVERSDRLLPFTTLLQKSESLLRRPKQSHPLTTHWPKPLMVPSSVLSTVDLPPFLQGERLKEAIGVKVYTKKQRSPKQTRKSMSTSLCKAEATTSMLVTSKPHSSSYVPGETSHPVNVVKLTEANAGFRTKIDPPKTRFFPKSSPVSHLKSQDSSEIAISTLQNDAKMKKCLVQVSDQVLKQVDVESFCARYSLTHAEFAQLLEEFSILSLTGYSRLPISGVPEGVQASVLCAHYQVSFSALRAINPHLFDLPSTDPLDVRRVIAPSGLLSWPDFVSFYTLAVLQRGNSVDNIAFLLRLLKVSRREELEKTLLFENLKRRLDRAFTETIRGIWSKVCDSLTEDCSSMEPESLAAAISRGKATLLDLRYLVAHVFRQSD